jgi:hypothetical protein
LGGAFGVAATSTVFTAPGGYTTEHAIVAGYRAAMIMAPALARLAVVTVALSPRGWAGRLFRSGEEIRRAVSGRPVFGFADTNFASLSILTDAARRVDEWPDRRAIQQQVKENGL